MSSDFLEGLDSEARAVLGGAPDSVEALVHSAIASTTGGVWRVRSGPASAIAKVVRPRGDDPDDRSLEPGSFRYFRREEVILESDVLDPYRDAGIRPPRLLGRFDRTEGVALWLEDVEGRPGAGWSLDRFGDAAERLGRAQGAIARRGVPDRPWLSRAFLRDYLDEHARRTRFDVLDSEAAWSTPLISAVVPPGLREELVRLHADRSRFLAWLDAAPRTLSHLDVWPNNLFATDEDVVLVDWAFAGVGALGEDVGNLVPDSVFDLLHPASILPDLDRVVFGAYLRGLRDGGWDGDERLVRLAMCASSIKYDWLGPAMLLRAMGDERPVGYGGAAVDDPTILFRARAAGLAFLVGWANEARRLADVLRLNLA